MKNPGSGCGYSAGLHHVPGTIDDTAQQVWVTRIFCARSVVPVRGTPAGPVMIIPPVAGANVFFPAPLRLLASQHMVSKVHFFAGIVGRPINRKKNEAIINNQPLKR